VVQVGGLVGPLAWGWLSDALPRKLIMQASLLLTAVTTLWLGQQQALDILLIVNLVLHGLVVHARGTITQAMVGDYAEEDVQDAAFSIYFTVGLISAPLWAVIVGTIMGHWGFAAATQVMACSYVLGMLLLIPVRMSPRPVTAQAA
jgi:MFS family permease